MGERGVVVEHDLAVDAAHPELGVELVEIDVAGGLGHALVDVARTAFPALPPYGEPEHVVVPHCTIGTDDDPETVEAMVRDLREGLVPLLPIRCRAAELVLLGEGTDGRWARREAIPFDGA